MTTGEKDKFAVWARQINASDEGAFSELFHEVYPRLVKYAAQFTKRKTPAHDIVQEVFIKLWNVRANIDPGQSLLSYLYKMVRNRSLNYLRDNADYHVSLDDISPEAFKTNDERFSKNSDNKEGEKMLALIDALPKRRREALKLSRFEGLSHSEIAYVMQISPRTVNNHITAALSSLKKDLNTDNNQSKRGIYEG